MYMYIQKTLFVSVVIISYFPPEEEQTKRVVQRKKESSMLEVSLRDRIEYLIIKTPTVVRDALESILHLKWNWAGYVARMSDEPWTRTILEWTPRHEAY